jgi:hypothetical protein
MVDARPARWAGGEVQPRRASAAGSRSWRSARLSAGIRGPGGSSCSGSRRQVGRLGWAQERSWARACGRQQRPRAASGRPGRTRGLATAGAGQRWWCAALARACARARAEAGLGGSRRCGARGAGTQRQRPHAGKPGRRTGARERHVRNSISSMIN